jgi:hypothetical protein
MPFFSLSDRFSDPSGGQQRPLALFCHTCLARPLSTVASLEPHTSMHKHKIITPTTRPSRKGPAISAWLTAIARQHADFELINERGEFAPEAIS